MKAGKDTTTYQLNISEYSEHFEQFLKQGLDVVHVCLSSGITGTITAARTAAEMLAAEYPGNKVWVVDSLGASSGYGLLMSASISRIWRRMAFRMASSPALPLP